MLLTLNRIPKVTSTLLWQNIKVNVKPFTPVFTKFYTTTSEEAMAASDKTKVTSERIKIGDVTKDLKPPKNPELVPQKYVQYNEDGTLQLTQSALHHLRWMLQKDILKQDMFLIGQPGSLRRQLAMQYLELTQRELEYIALSRDTTESDTKEELDKLGVLRVSEDFRVVALGLPTHKYKGTPLDPPLRSRFQSRNVSHFLGDANRSADSGSKCTGG